MSGLSYLFMNTGDGGGVDLFGGLSLPENKQNIIYQKSYQNSNYIRIINSTNSSFMFKLLILKTVSFKILNNLVFFFNCKLIIV